MIPFISRHIPTVAQEATVADRFGELRHVGSVVFEPGRVSAQVSSATDAADRIVAGVFPTWAALELLMSGWTVVEFANEPSARARGVFVCRGAYVYSAEIERDVHRDVVSLLPSEFIPCPLPADEQEESSLAPT